MTSVYRWCVTFALTVVVTATVEPIYAPHVMFHHGVLDEGMHCSDTEWDMMTRAVQNRPHRQLGHRHLRRCGCALCIFAGNGCGGHSTRRLTSVRRRRRVVAPSTCEADMATVTAALDALTVSPSCAALIQPAFRTITCRPVVPCDIDTVHVWNAHTKQVLYPNYPLQDGPPLCSNVRLTFQVTTHFDVGSVQFVLRGPQTEMMTMEYNAPYFMHGNVGYHQVYGTYFDVGNYTLTLTSPSEQRIVSFQVQLCNATHV